MVLTEMVIGGRWRPAAGQATVGTCVGAASPVTAEACAAAAERLAEGWSFVAIGSDATLLAATVTTELARARPSTPDLRGGQT
jgi:hypothetical protein